MGSSPIWHCIPYKQTEPLADLNSQSHCVPVECSGSIANAYTMKSNGR